MTDLCCICMAYKHTGDQFKMDNVTCVLLLKVNPVWVRRSYVGKITYLLSMYNYRIRFGSRHNNYKIHKPAIMSTKTSTKVVICCL